MEIDLRNKVESFCSECKSHNLIVDYKIGSILCSDCGLVSNDQIISDESEWRNFANETPKGGVDRNRVGGATNPLLEGMGLSTDIAVDEGSSTLSKLQNSMSSSSKYRTLLDGFSKIDHIGKDLGLSSGIVLRAQELLKYIHDNNVFRNSVRDAKLAAAVFFACREFKVDRTVKELSGIFQVDKKVIGRVILKMKQRLLEDRSLKKSQGTHKKSKMDLFTGSDSAFMNRFGRMLKLPPHTISAAIDVVTNLKPIGICDGQTPAVVASAALYLICQLKPDTFRNVNDIAQVAHISDSVISSTYRKIFPFRARLVPEDYMPAMKVCAISESLQ